MPRASKSAPQAERRNGVLQVSQGESFMARHNAGMKAINESRDRQMVLLEAVETTANKEKIIDIVAAEFESEMCSGTETNR